MRDESSRYKPAAILGRWLFVLVIVGLPLLGFSLAEGWGFLGGLFLSAMAIGCFFVGRMAPRLGAIARFCHGNALERSSAWEEAMSEYETTLMQLRRLRDPVMESFVYAHQARVRRNQGQLKQAQERIHAVNRLLDMAQEDWNKRYVQSFLHNVWGTLCMKLQLACDKSEACAHFREALRLGETLLAELPEMREVGYSFGLLIERDPSALVRQLTHNLGVNRVNLAEMLLHRGETERGEAERLAWEVMAVGQQFQDYKLQGAAFRILGEIAEERAESVDAETGETWRDHLRDAEHWYQEALDSYLLSKAVFPEAGTAAFNSILRVQTALGQDRWEKAGRPESYPEVEKVPEEIVFRDRPFLANVENLARCMPIHQKWRFYYTVARRWLDAGWLGRTYRYLVKSFGCLDEIRVNMPLLGDFLTQRRAQLMESGEPLAELLLALLLSREHGPKTEVADRTAEAFAYREKLGPTGLLDELELANALGSERLPESETDEKLGYQDIISGKVLPLLEVQELLPERTVLIEYVLTESLLAAFVVTKTTAEVPLLAQVVFGLNADLKNELEITPDQLTQNARNFVTAIGHERYADGTPTFSGLPEEKDLARIKEKARWLYDVLLRPTEFAWCDNGRVSADRLIIIPHGVLHDVPFATLFDGAQFVVEKIPVIKCPSASTLRYCYDKRPHLPVPITYFGLANPMAETADWKPYRSTAQGKGIIGCENVVLVAAKHVGSTETWQNHRLGQAGTTVLGVRRGAASRANLLKNAPHFTIVDLETHGEYCRDGASSGLLNHRFLVVGDKGEPYWFTAKEVFLHLRMQPELLVVAMCHGGRVEMPVGDEMIGLLRAFLFAGCRSILAYPWVLVDEVGATFMGQFYEHLIMRDVSGAPKALANKDHALRRAQLHLLSRGRAGDTIKSRGTSVPWEHPYYWAWDLVGDHA